MRVANTLDNIELDADTVVTIGTFDGVHRGHQYLVEQLVRRARETGRLSVVLTFHPHPRMVLNAEARPAYLSSPEERADILGGLGLDLLVILPFTREVASTPAAAFIGQLYNKLRLRELWVGAGFALGRGREGDVTNLQQLAAQFGYALRVISPLYDGDEPISSTRIRTLLLKGRVEEVTRLLGRPYAVSGSVVKGVQRGRSLGFRTANLQLDPERAAPADGVYAVWAVVDGERRRGVANLGVRPSFGAGERLLEVHLLDYNGDLYGRKTIIEFMRWIRPEMRFDDVSALIEQIRRDIVEARAVLNREGEMMSEKDHPPFEELEHTADLRLGVHGGSLEELFVHAAQGMFHLMRCQPQGEGQTVAHRVTLESYDLEALLVDWLNELIYLREANQECFDAYEIIRLEPTRLEATVRGTTGHLPQKVIKAATFSGLKIVRGAAGYGVTITFDV